MEDLSALLGAPKTGEYDIVSFGTRIEWEEEAATVVLLNEKKDCISPNYRV